MIRKQLDQINKQQEHLKIHNKIEATKYQSFVIMQ